MSKEAEEGQSTHISVAKGETGELIEVLSRFPPQTRVRVKMVDRQIVMCPHVLEVTPKEGVILHCNMLGWIPREEEVQSDGK